MQKYIALIKRCPLFQGIGEEDILRVLPCLGARIQHCDKDEVLLREGEPAPYFGILLSGRAHISATDYFGVRSLVAEIGKGDLFAESFTLAGVPMPVSVTAVEPGTFLLIDGARLTRTCEHSCPFHQKVIYNLMQILALKNIELHQRREITSRRTTREKLLAYLHLLARQQQSRTLQIPFDRQALADFLGVDRSGLSHEIGKLRQEGILQCRKNHFKLL